jgi:hypothetical protein
MSYLPLLPNDEHFVVTLNGPNVYGKSNYEYTDLNMKPVRSFVGARFLAIRLQIVADKKNQYYSCPHRIGTNIKKISKRFAAQGSNGVKLINSLSLLRIMIQMKRKQSVKGMISPGQNNRIVNHLIRGGRFQK